MLQARSSNWVTPGMRQRAAEALMASDQQQLPELVHLFNEISHRLENAQKLLQLDGNKWLPSIKELRRCDMLLQEAELRLRFLQGAVGNMYFAVGRDEAITWEETERLAHARAALKFQWACILPQMCFGNKD